MGKRKGFGRKKSNAKDQFPARELVETSPHRSTGGGHFEGLTDYDAQFESHNEKNAIMALVLCHDVHSISSQPIKNEFDDGAAVRGHIPDFSVKTYVPLLFIEIKSLSFLATDSSLEKYLPIAQGYLRKNQPFAFLVDAQLEAEPRFASIKLLFRYVKSKIPDHIITKANDALATAPLAINELQSKGILELVDIYTLIAKRHLCFDWAQPLNPSVKVSLPNQPFEGLKLERILRSTRFSDLLATLAMGRRPQDQCLLEDAKTWRQPHRQPGPFSNVGGFFPDAPLRDLSQGERSAKSIWRRRDRAPGGGSLASDENS